MLEAQENIKGISQKDLVESLNLAKKLIEEDRSRCRQKVLEAERFSSKQALDRVQSNLEVRESSSNVISSLFKLAKHNTLKKEDLQ